MTRLLPLLSLVILSLPSAAHAKDLRKRFGLGFESLVGGSPSVSTTALSARFGLPTGNAAVNVQIEGDIGFSSYEYAPEGLFYGGRLLYSVVAEDNLNLYLAGGAGVLSVGGVNAVRIQPGMTVDFFLFGLENLGFSTGWAVNLDFGQGTSGVGSAAAAFAGAHYWF